MKYKCVCGRIDHSPKVATAHFTACDAWARANAPRSIWTPPQKRYRVPYDEFGISSFDGMHGWNGSVQQDIEDYRDREAMTV